MFNFTVACSFIYSIYLFIYLKLFYIFIFNYMNVLPVYMSVHHVCA